MDLTSELQDLLALEDSDHLFLSLYLDNSVTSDGQRTYPVFFKKKVSLHTRLLAHQRGEKVVREFRENLKKIESYLQTELDPSTQGVAIFCSVERDFFKALQLPAKVRNKFAVSTSPNLDVLIELVESSRHYGIVTLDQQSGRIYSVYLSNQPEMETELSEDLPGRTKVGGWSQMRYQRHRKDLIQHFMKELAEQLRLFVQREKPEKLILLGTQANISEFRKHLPAALSKRVLLTRSIPKYEDEKELVAKVRRFIAEAEKSEEKARVSEFYERLSQDYLAVAGRDETLFNLQMGRLDRLFISERLNGTAYRCVNCDFVFSRNVVKCPYCRSQVEAVELRNRMEKLAEHHDVDLELVGPSTFLDELDGVGGLLKF